MLHGVRRRAGSYLARAVVPHLASGLNGYFVPHYCTWLGAAKGYMVISINEYPQIREVFAGLRLKEVPFRHMVGGQGGKQANELI